VFGVDPCNAGEQHNLRGIVDHSRMITIEPAAPLTDCDAGCCSQSSCLSSKNNRPLSPPDPKSRQAILASGKNAETSAMVSVRNASDDDATAHQAGTWRVGEEGWTCRGCQLPAFGSAVPIIGVFRNRPHSPRAFQLRTFDHLRDNEDDDCPKTPPPQQ